MMVFRVGVFSLLGGIFLVLLVNTLYVPHAPQTNVSLNCAGVTRSAAHCPQTNAKPAPALVATTPGSPHTMIVDIRASEIERAAPTLMKQARFVPTVRDGRRVGFKVFAIRPGSLPAMLGLENGDTVTAVNDTSIANASSFDMPSLSAPTTPKVLDIDLTRRGQALRILVVVHRDSAT